jgi:hypothetical protein
MSQAASHGDYMCLNPLLEVLEPKPHANSLEAAPVLCWDAVHPGAAGAGGQRPSTDQAIVFGRHLSRSRHPSRRHSTIQCALLFNQLTHCHRYSVQLPQAN